MSLNFMDVLGLHGRWIRCSGCGVFGVLVVLLFGFCFLSSWDTLLCLDLDTMHHVGNPPRINIRQFQSYLLTCLITHLPCHNGLVERVNCTNASFNMVQQCHTLGTTPSITSIPIKAYPLEL